MSYLARMLVLIGVIAGLSACAGLNAPQNIPAPQFSYRHSSFDLTVSWNTQHTGNVTVITGLIKNVRYPEVQDIDLTVMVYDPGGKLLAKGGFLPVPAPLKMGESAPFSVTVKSAPFNKGDILAFIISYRANDGARVGFDWLSSFKVDAATGAAIEE